MIRQIIHIDEDKCNGCGLCSRACHEGAIGIVNGKAKLLRDDYCDGMGDCLPACPMNALSFEEREAADYDEAAVQEHLKQKKEGLTNWPVQIRLCPVKADYFNGRELLIAADCTAYSYEGFHRELIPGRTVLVGCPKLDPVDYSDKLTEIFRNNDITSILLVRMSVPCCSGLEKAVQKAISGSGKALSLRVMVLDRLGNQVK